MEREGERLAKAVSGKEDARKLGGGGRRGKKETKQTKVFLCILHLTYTVSFYRSGSLHIYIHKNTLSYRQFRF